MESDREKCPVCGVTFNRFAGNPNHWVHYPSSRSCFNNLLDAKVAQLTAAEAERDEARRERDAATAVVEAAKAVMKCVELSTDVGSLRLSFDVLRFALAALSKASTPNQQ